MGILKISYPKDWVHLLVGVKPKDTIKREQEKEDLLLVAS